MKIGLIGINRYAKFLNFACDLHIYAFQQFLADHEYDSTILDYKPVYFGNFDMRNPAPGAERAYLSGVKKNLKGQRLKKLADLAMGYRSASVERERRYDKFAAFVDSHLTFTNEQYDSDLLEVRDPGFDCYICVTDVIWQSLDNYGFDRGFMLGSKAFEGKAKIAYAASRGASLDFDERRLEMFSSYLENVDAVSVREQDFGEYIDTHTGVDARVVADPVLLHDRPFWESVTVEPVMQGYVLLYYVMEKSADTIAAAVEYAKLHNLKLVEVSDRPFKYGLVNDPDVEHFPIYDMGMEEWLGYVRNADAVFTNSFHGCCFSLVFEKLFFVGRRNGNKVPNFLATFDLESQLFEPGVDVARLSPEIDFTAARKAWSTLRARSEDFVLQALETASRKSADESAREIAAGDARRRELEYECRFHSGRVVGGEVVQIGPKTEEFSGDRTKSRAIEYSWEKGPLRNDGKSAIPKVQFTAWARRFAGWAMRFRVDNRWFWLMADGTVEPGNLGASDLSGERMVLEDQAVVPTLPVNHVDVAVFVAQWEDDSSLGAHVRFGSARLGLRDKLKLGS